MKNRLKKQAGITLLELMVVIVIIAILLSIAIPSYRGQVTKARRADGLVSLLELTNRLERYYMENHSFVGASVSELISSDKSPEGYYLLSLSNLSATNYTASATPTGPQLNADKQCGILSINALGQKKMSGSGKVSQCWK